MTVHRDPGRWSLSRWFVTFAFVFGIQGILVFLFSDREKGSVPLEPKQAAVYYLGLAHTELSQANQSLARDASLLTRPHERSFTGPLWNQTVTAEREYTAWTEDSRYYTRTQYIAGAALKQHLLQNVIPPTLVSRSHPELSEAEKPHALPIPKTSLLFSGEIKPRSPQVYSSLPSWPHTNLVQPSVITVALDRFGWAQSTLVISNSLAEADAHALRWIRETRFQPLPPNRKVIDTGLTWGEITFRWATETVEKKSKGSVAP
ncbi:hypothetical protein N8494_00665 [bacterium]|jgi:hypothetical protein|nr:hypothetical protein [bacterium]MDA7645601.1 hypothetical protein [bacterium]